MVLSHDRSEEDKNNHSVYESDVQNGITGPQGVRFSQPSRPKKMDVTILLLANPRAGSRLAGRFVTDYPRETTKLVVQGDNCMTSCKLLIYDVTDKDDKVEYFS